MNRRVAIALSFVTILGASLAYGQSATPKLGRLNVPFNFTVGTQELPAGTYEVLRQTRWETHIQLRNVQSGKSTFVPIIERLAEKSPAARHGARITFDTDGQQKFLSEFWPANNTDGYLLGIHKAQPAGKILQARR